MFRLPIILFAGVFCLFGMQVQAQVLAVSATAVNSCNQPLCNGSVTAAATGGSPTYQYKLNNTAYQLSPIFTGLCNGTYTLTVRDASLTTASIIITLSGFNFSLSGINCSSLSACDGSISIAFSGGTAPYSFNVTGPSGFQTYTASTSPFTISNCCVGSYSVTATDAANCSATFPGSGSGNSAASISIGAGGGAASPLFVSMIGTFPSCPAPLCPVASLSAAGGQAPYQYSFSLGTYPTGGPWSASASSSCLPQGSIINVYGCVRDAFGSTSCTQLSMQIMMNAPSSSVAFTPDFCGSCSGTITVSSPFTAQYYLDNSTVPQAANVFTNICAGVHSVTIDPVLPTLCPVYVSLNVPAVTVLQPTVAVQAPSCAAACNGVITVNVNGPPPLQYSIDNGVTWQTSNVFTGRCSGTYTVTARNVNNTSCSGSATAVVPAAPVPVLTLSSVQPTCPGVCNGSVTAAVAPAGTYQFSIDNGATWQFSSGFSGLCAGTYTVQAVSGSCTASASATLAPAAPAVTATAAVTTAPNCTSPCGGVVTVSASPAAAYQYSFNNSAFFASPVFSALCYGTYTFTAWNPATTCSSSVVTALVPPPPVTFTFTTTDAVCSNTCSGSVTLVPSGNSTYQYQLGSSGWVNNGNFINVCAGTYTAQVKDMATGCTASQNVTVSAPPPITLSAVNTNPSCHNGCNGTVTINASPVSAYQYSMNNGPLQAGNQFSGLCAGINTFTVINSVGCTTSQTVALSNPAAISLNVSSVSPNCNGSCTGSFTVVASPVAIYQYSLNSNPLQSSNQFSGLCASTYTLTATSTAGCTASVTRTLTNTLPPVTVSAVVNDVSCASVCDGIITAQVSPAGTYQYSLNNLPLQSSGVFSGLCQGTNRITAISAAGCFDTLLVAVVEQPPATAQLSATPPTCTAICGGSIAVDSVSPPGAYQFSINSGPLQTQNLFSQLCAGTYTVTIERVPGCTFTDTLTVQPPPVFTVQTITDSTSCPNRCDGSIVVQPSLPGSYTYQLNTNIPQTSPVLANVCAGLYQLTVTGAAGCVVQDSVAVNSPAPVLLSTVIVLPSCENTCDAALTIIPSVPGNYVFSIDSGLNYQPFDQFTGLCSGEYLLQLKNDEGCVYSQTDTISATPPLPVSIQVTDPLCAASCTGQLVVSSPGAVQFSLNNITQSTSAFYGLCTGTYTVYVTDSIGCTGTDTAVVNSPAPLILTATSQPAVCGSCNGNILYSAAGGTPAYVYSITAASQSATNGSLCPGIYTVQVTDSNDCADIVMVLVDSLPFISIDSVSVVSDTDSSSTGTIEVFTSGSQPQIFNWIPAVSSTAQAAGLSAGVYCITVTDSLGCSDSVCVTVGNILSGISELNQFSIRAVPNPFTADIVLAGTPFGSLFQLTDASGRLVFSGKVAYDGRLNLPSQLASGIYTLQVQHTDFRAQLQVVKIQ